MSDYNALLQQGVAAYQQGDLAAAERHCRDAIAAQPRCLDAYHILAVIQLSLGRPQEALAACEMALSLRPDDPLTLSNRSVMLNLLGRHEEAVASCDVALSLQPDGAPTLQNRGIALSALKRFDAAMASYDRALEVQPEFAECRLSRASLLLLRGALSEGWREYESRRKLATWAAPHFDGPEWQGDDVSGRRLLLYGEGWPGDTIQFARFVPLLAERARAVIVQVEPSLCGLMRRVAGAAQVVALGEPPPPYDCHLPLASVPFVLRIEEAQIPAAAPYLTAEPDRIVAWSERLPQAGFRVGIAGEVEPGRGGWQERAIPLAGFAPLGRIPGVQLIALGEQAGPELAAALPSARSIGELGTDFGAGSDRLLDLAAVMMQLDLIVTGNGVIAHLAGALGRPVWILLKDVPTWRWLLERTDSPWYPTARLFRQSRSNTWEEAIAAAAGALAPIVAQKAEQSDRMPASPAAAIVSDATMPSAARPARLSDDRGRRDANKAAYSDAGAKPTARGFLTQASNGWERHKSALANPSGAATVRHTLAARVSGAVVASLVMLAPLHPFQGSAEKTSAGSSTRHQTAYEMAIQVAEPRPQPQAKSATDSQSHRVPRAIHFTPAPALMRHQETASAARITTAVTAPAPTGKLEHVPTSTSVTVSRLPAPAPRQSAPVVATAPAQPPAALFSAVTSASPPPRATANRPTADAAVPEPRVASAEEMKPRHPPTSAAAGIPGMTLDATHPATAALSRPPVVPAGVEAANSALRARGDALLATGDITSARLFYKQAAEEGDGRAALRLGETYDPDFLAQIRLIGAWPDAAAAAHWYRRAREMGVGDADVLLKGIAQHAAARGLPQ
ncbi:MAG TPA: tetratricopeptide repeat protein [Stellaceae bacterium]|nr:tetratricopeptide repeat protein [Stellaceae bacterium]